MSNYKKQFHDKPFINPETGRRIVINGPTYKKLVKKYGQPKISVTNSKVVKNSGFLHENDVIDSKIILMVDDISTLGNLYLSYKDRFSKLLNNKFILDQLKVKYELPENFHVNSFKDFINIVGGIPPSKFDLGMDINRGQYPDERDRLSPDLRWKQKGKELWLNKLKLIENYSTHIKVRRDHVAIRGLFFPSVHYSALSSSQNWDSNTVYAIKYDYMTPIKTFYYFVNNEYIALPKENKLNLEDLSNFIMQA
jgi:hypothetical protein